MDGRDDRRDGRDDRRQTRWGPESNNRDSNQPNRLPPPPVRSNPPPPRGGDPTPPEPKSVVKGTVTSVRPFGVFVKPSGKSRDGLVHCSQVSDELTFTREDSDDAKVMAMEYFFPKGTEVFVKVLDVRFENEGYAATSNRPPKVSLSMKLVDQETGDDLDPDHEESERIVNGGGRNAGRGNNNNGSDDPPPYGSVHKATVSSIKPYGVFCKPSGFRRDVLVPSHQVSEYLTFTKEDLEEDRVAGISGVVAPGDSVFMKIVEIREGPGGPSDKVRVTGSMKLCDQTGGDDLDPDNSKYRPQGNPGGGGDFNKNTQPGDAVKLGGVIDWGHHLGDVKQMAGGSQYALVESDVGNDRAAEGVRFDGRGPDGRMPPPPPPGGPPRNGGGTFVVSDRENQSAPGVIVGSIEEALEILAKHKREKKARKAVKKAKKKKSKKEKSSKRRRRDLSDSDSDLSSYSSSDSRRDKRRKR